VNIVCHHTKFGNLYPPYFSGCPSTPVFDNDAESFLYLTDISTQKNKDFKGVSPSNTKRFGFQCVSRQLIVGIPVVSSKIFSNICMGRTHRKLTAGSIKCIVVKYLLS